MDSENSSLPRPVALVTQNSLTPFVCSKCTFSFTRLEELLAHLDIKVALPT